MSDTIYAASEVKSQENEPANWIIDAARRWWSEAEDWSHVDPPTAELICRAVGDLLLALGELRGKE